MRSEWLSGEIQAKRKAIATLMKASRIQD